MQDASKCTATGLYTVENNSKPLVLKELKKLWDKEEEPDDLPWQQGEFSPSNTLLVDDSPYKALRNPVCTYCVRACVFPVRSFPHLYITGTAQLLLIRLTTGLYNV
jgi:hypothetical protein